MYLLVDYDCLKASCYVASLNDDRRSHSEPSSIRTPKRIGYELKVHLQTYLNNELK